MRSSTFLSVTLAATLMACASGGGSATAGSAEAPRTAAASRRTNVITADEIAQHPGVSSVSDLVRQIRPMWGQASIFVDNTPFSGTLRDIEVGGVQEVRYLTPSEAQMRWGSRVQYVILVTTKK